ncbi:glycosyltransferase [Streptomyces antimicrobicus]|uniref:Glycosyltransferase n=1 Tax=Streptomyces antimicrobicus TaxID=2883108 RepID=A0ABS8B3M8_9ACTN|nr:glycosyltransferase [Streptomyces antimicrobicus]MCB5179184.1 glycosyltransferase [Streptomyces antimicrobicus]
MNAPAGSPYAVVVPTVGRPQLRACLEALADTRGPGPARVVVVHDRPGPDGAPPPLEIPDRLRSRTLVVAGAARGPAAARNLGWRAAGAVPWVVFLDDDVVPGPDWGEELARDLAAAGPGTAAVSARIEVPLPADRRPTDWERCTAGLATARWITADMAVRTEALRAADGFDERFHRAFREDADLALRLLGGGWGLVGGTRRTRHPVRPADRWVSVRAQAGNADDVLMHRLHGAGWRARAGERLGRRPGHLAVTAAGCAAVAGALLGHRRAAGWCAAAWLAGTVEFAAARILPGPRDRSEILTMAVTSVLVPPAATWHWLRGLAAHRRVAPARQAAPPAHAAPAGREPAATPAGAA